MQRPAAATRLHAGARHLGAQRPLDEAGVLRQRFGEHTPIDSIGWKGWNRVATRTKGALALANHIKDAPACGWGERTIATCT